MLRYARQTSMGNKAVPECIEGRDQVLLRVVHIRQMAATRGKAYLCRRHGQIKDLLAGDRLWAGMVVVFWTAAK